MIDQQHASSSALEPPTSAFFDDLYAKDASANDRPPPRTFEQIAKQDGGMRYTVLDVPPLLPSILFGLQHVLTMLGATVLVPILLTSQMGATPLQTAETIATVFVVQGVNTLLQTTIGDRLPIVQGSSFAYLPAAFSIIANPELQAIQPDELRFVTTMRVLQGAIITVGLIQIGIGYSGAFCPLLRYIGPVTIAPVITAIGLGLYANGWANISTCWSIGLTQLVVTILFSQYLKHVGILGQNIFALFPIILAIAFSWSLAAILTAAGVWAEGSACRTDSARTLMEVTPVFRIPYPFQWGTPIFESYAIVPMIGSMLAGMIESIGDYFSCAKMAGAPPPTPGIIARGQGGEGWGVLIAGLYGTGNGTTSYSENIGAISITRVGSRAVVQVGAVLLCIMGLFTKIAALFASIPTAILGGMYCVVFALIVGVGLSNLQYIDLNSSRNIFIVGFSIFNAMSLAGPGGYFATAQSNPFGNSPGGEIAYALFSSPMIIAMICAFVLDNTIHGSRRERGLHIWDRVRFCDVNQDEEYRKVYSLPFFLAKLFRNCAYLEWYALQRIPDPPPNGYQGGRGDICDLLCCCICRRNNFEEDDVGGENAEDRVEEGEKGEEEEYMEQGADIDKTA